MEGICHCQYQQCGWSAPWSVLSSEEEIEYVYVTDKERVREKLLHRKIILILAICVCVYSSCCSTNSWGNINKNCHSIYSLIYFTEHLGNEPVKESMLALGKRNAVLIPKISSLIHCEILSVNFRRPQRNCDKWVSCVKRFGICKASRTPGAYLSLSGVADTLWSANWVRNLFETGVSVRFSIALWFWSASGSHCTSNLI